MFAFVTMGSEQAANNAKAGCPVSKLLNARITMEARLAEERAA